MDRKTFLKSILGLILTVAACENSKGIEFSLPSFIPMQTIYNTVQDKGATYHWSLDGVHPSLAGEYLLANTWLDILRILN